MANRFFLGQDRRNSPEAKLQGCGSNSCVLPDERCIGTQYRNTIIESPFSGGSHRSCREEIRSLLVPTYRGKFNGAITRPGQRI